MELRSYSQIYTLGHPAIDELFDGIVEVSEKIDGSQFSFGLKNGEFVCRSKGKNQTHGTDDMFIGAYEAMKALPLREGWTYRGELLTKPKHNVLEYARIPEKHVILFNIDAEYERYLSYNDMCEEARRIGLEVVPILKLGNVPDWSALAQLLDTKSCLGGVNIEGMVIKNYKRFGRDGKVMMGKLVNETFKERLATTWKKEHNPSGGDIIDQLIASFGKEAIWRKAVQHLRDNGTLPEGPQAIGPLIAEISLDVQRENADDIKQVLYDWAWKKILRGVTAGFPQWFKEQLAKEQFEE